MSVTYNGGRGHVYKSSSKKSKSKASKKGNNPAKSKQKTGSGFEEIHADESEDKPKKKPSYLKKRVKAASQIDVKAGHSALDKIRQAAKEHKLVELLYWDAYGRKSRRTIEPYSLKLSKGTWKVFGFCGLRKAIRCFELKSILEAVIQDVVFEPKYEITIEADMLNMRSKPL